LPEHLVLDAANIIGSRPDGWWRDRAAAAQRLAASIGAALDAGTLDADVVHLVLEGAAARATDVPTHDRLVVVRAPADGDATIAALAVELDGAATVVTADRALRARVEQAGARVMGPGSLLAQLP